MYAKVISGQVVQFPYSLGDLQDEYPNTSFSAHLPDNVLALVNVVRVIVTGAPEHDPETQVADQDGCAFIPERNRWETTWTVRDK